MLNSTLVQNIINATYNDIDIESILDFDINNFIEHLKINSDFLDLMEIGEYAFECYNTNRFVGIESEHDMEGQAYDLALNGSFFAGMKN